MAPTKSKRSLPDIFSEPKSLTREQFRAMLVQAGLEQATVMVHASLRRFGKVEGGADAMIDVLTEVCRNVMMPGFQCYGNCRPPEPSWLLGQGYGTTPLASPADLAVYDPFLTPMHSSMGFLSQSFARKKNTYRSDHPWNSWLVRGPEANFLVGQRDWHRPNLPIENSLKLNSRVLLLGVTFDKCTALHLAEEKYGRILFVRWTKTREGIQPMKINGCGRGFKKADFLFDGKYCVSSQEILEKSIKILNKNKKFFCCDTTNCARCKESKFQTK